MRGLVKVDPSLDIPCPLLKSLAASFKWPTDVRFWLKADSLCLCNWCPLSGAKRTLNWRMGQSLLLASSLSSTTSSTISRTLPPIVPIRFQIKWCPFMDWFCYSLTSNEQIALLGVIFVIGTFTIIFKSHGAGFLVEKLLALGGVLLLVYLGGCR